MAIPDYTRVAAAFEGDRPAGPNLREDPELVRQYHLIRDARSAARSEDRSLENPVVIDGGQRGGGDDIHPPSARWKDVHDLALQALETQSKDIELLAWLAEATIRVYGIEALAGVLAATVDLVGTRFDALHSVDDESVADRVAPFGGLNGSQDSDGTLIRPLRLNSLSPTNIYGRLSLWELDKAKKAGDAAVLSDFQQEFGHLDGRLFKDRTAAVESCRLSIAELDRMLTELCGADGPSFSRIKDVLDDISRAYVELGVHVSLPTDAAEGVHDAASEQTAAEAPNGAQPARPAPGQIMDREQAFRTLLEVAAFFRRTEPHSTIPMALETLVRRGRMDFMGLLSELLPDENQRREMLTRAGIKPEGP